MTSLNDESPPLISDWRTESTCGTTSNEEAIQDLNLPQFAGIGGVSSFCVDAGSGAEERIDSRGNLIKKTENMDCTDDAMSVPFHIISPSVSKAKSGCTVTSACA